MTPDGVAKVFSLNFLKKTVSVKLEDGKVKEYSKDDIEMLDGEVDIEIDTAQSALDYHDEGETLDLKSLDNDKNSSTGNI